MAWIEELRKIVEKERGREELKNELIERSGRLTENKARRALKKLEREGRIQGFEQSIRFSFKDRKGIDFTIYTQEGKKVFLQVKAFLYPDTKQSLQLEEIAPGIWQKGEIYNIEIRREEKSPSIMRKILKILELEKRNKKTLSI